jgi:hypothetical protein
MTGATACYLACNARERLLKRQAERHHSEDHDKYCEEQNFH